jgi:hypothetical protein
MARKATGQVIPPGAKARSWALRFRAYGERHYVTLGRPEDGWDRKRAEAELRHIPADSSAACGAHPHPRESRAPQNNRHSISSRASGLRRGSLSCARAQ